MKKICFFSGDITRSGGTEKVACQIANGLCGYYDVSVVSLTEAGEMFYKLDERISHIGLFNKFPNGIKQYVQIVTRLRKYLKENRIDVLIDVDTILDMFSVTAVAFSKVKLIAWEHFNFHETMGNKLRVPVRKYMTRFADCVVTLTREDRQYYKDYFGDKLRIEQIYNPIDIEISEHEYDINSKTIISVGRLARQKGFDMLVDVADKVLKSHADWEWIILGEGDDREMLEKKIAEKQIDNLKLLGRVSNVSEYMQKSAIYVMTSRYEGFPLVLIEAKANKLPVVTFSCKTGPTELIQNDINGRLIDCFDVDAMAESINVLIDNNVIRQNYSDMALLDTDKMNFKGIINKWVEVINSL